MKKYLIMAMVLVFSISLVMAGKPDFVPETNDKSGVLVVIPAHAVEVADGVFSLGTSVDVDGRVVEGYAIIDYRKGFHHRPGHGGGPGGSGGGKKSSCFAYLAKGAKWKSQESYMVDPANNAGLNEGFIRANLASDIDEWESAAGYDVFGNEVAGTINPSEIQGLNGKNEVIFADIDRSGVIGVTYVWGYFSGPPGGRELVEWNQVYDDVDFAWSSNGAAGTMDFENIAQHELGHSFGLGHPSGDCTEETMYAYASLGETKKRDLNPGDITGISKLYR